MNKNGPDKFKLNISIRNEKHQRKCGCAAITSSESFLSQIVCRLCMDNQTESKEECIEVVKTEAGSMMQVKVT
jgi:hypothetical protein